MADENALAKIRASAGLVEAKPPRQKGRDGMKGLLTYHSPAVMQQLKIIGAEQGRNQTQLVAEALNMLFTKYGKKTIA